MTTYALEVENLNFQFSHQETPFFQNVSFQLEAGKLHHLKGKNGSGKSTLFSLLRGDAYGIYSKEGKVSLHQKQYAQSQLPSLKSILHQEMMLMNQRYDALIADQFSFQDNLKFARLSHYPSFYKRLNLPSLLPSFIEYLGINMSTPAYLLSGGQRQILALIMALQKRPSILLLDEPTATLDPFNAQLVFEFLQELSHYENLTILTICHDDELIETYRNGKQLEIYQTPTGSRMLIY